MVPRGTAHKLDVRFETALICSSDASNKSGRGLGQVSTPEGTIAVGESPTRDFGR